MECIGRTGMRSCLLRFRREKLWQMRGFYRVLLEILCEVEWVKSCFVVMEEIVKVRFTVDGCLGMRLIEKFVEQNMASEAEYLFREGVIKNKEGLGVLVEAMAEKGKPFVGLELIKFVNKSYLHGNGCVYACLIHSCGKIGLIHDAEKIFSEIKSSERVLDMGAVYSAVIYVYTREEMKKREEMIWCEMGNATGIQTNREAYMYMMSMYGALGLIEELLRLFDQMKRNVFHVSIDVYIAVISALSKAGKLNQAREFLLEMRNGGIKPTNSVYSLMMEGYVGIGLTSHGLALIDEYKKSGLQLDEIVVTSVVKILSEAANTLLG